MAETFRRVSGKLEVEEAKTVTTEYTRAQVQAEINQLTVNLADLQANLKNYTNDFNKLIAEKQARKDILESYLTQMTSLGI